MANLGMQFDSSAVAPRTAYDTIPAGKYTAQVIDSDVVPTKNGTGTRLKLTCEVLDGEYKGRKVFGNLNIVNDSPKAQEIGQAQLSALCHATGVVRLQDSVELHNRPMTIHVKVRKDETGTYQDQNEITSFSPLANGHAAPPPSAQRASQPQMPWQK